MVGSVLLMFIFWHIGSLKVHFTVWLIWADFTSWWSCLRLHSTDCKPQCCSFQVFRKCHHFTITMQMWEMMTYLWLVYILLHCLAVEACLVVAAFWSIYVGSCDHGYKSLPDCKDCTVVSLCWMRSDTKHNEWSYLVAFAYTVQFLSLYTIEKVCFIILC
jgi:hypothetical protein